tara:strand:+ start:1074 stop:1814 length:741 start_codon:yes stop_codon:yes gene_type:complete
MASKTKFENYEIRSIHRSKINPAPYNPRVIDDEAKTRLRKGLEDVGLLEPLVWNEKTGNLVGGHQRLSQIDHLEGNTDYMITVAVIKVDEKEEMEINILLNNPTTQGDWDFEQLKKMFDEEGIEAERSGFSAGDIYQLFGNDASAVPDETLKELNDQLEAAKSTIEKMDEDHARADDRDFYLVVIFKSHDERKKFTDSCGFDDNRYVDGKTLDHFVFDAEGDDAAERQSPAKKETKKETKTKKAKE